MKFSLVCSLVLCHSIRTIDARIDNITSIKNDVDDSKGGMAKNPSDARELTEMGPLYFSESHSCYEGYRHGKKSHSLNGDLNQSSGGKSIFLCLANNFQARGVTELKLVQDQSQCGSMFSLASCVYSLNGDLNQGAGGKDIYLCYSTSSSEKSPITTIDLHRQKPMSDLLPMLADGLNGDLNQSAGGKDIFFVIHREGSGAYMGPLYLSRDSACYNGYTRALSSAGLDGDLNQKAGGKDIFLCLADDFYNQGVTGLKLVRRVHCGSGWNQVSHVPTLNGDINQSAGGKDIFLCYSSLVSEGIPITDVYVRDQRPLDANMPLRPDGLNGDLNESAGGKTLFFEIYRRDPTLLQLNDAQIDFSSLSDPPIDSSATEVSLVDNSHAEIDANTLGNFGSSDFSIEFTFSSPGGDITPDGDWGTLFIRSDETSNPYTGPGAFIYNEGHIRFRMLGVDVMWCKKALPDKNSGAYTRELKFERIGSTLILTIDGVEECRKEMNPALTIDASKFVTAPLEFGIWGIIGNKFNLRATLSHIKLVGDVCSYTDGPNADNDGRTCDNWKGTLEEAKSRCTAESTCSYLHDWGDNGTNWRTCSAITVPGDGGAATKTKTCPIVCSYTDGPNADNDGRTCDNWSWTLEGAKSRCTAESTCSYLHNWNGYGNNWRLCSAITVPGDGRAATKTKTCHKFGDTSRRRRRLGGTKSVILLA